MQQCGTAAGGFSKMYARCSSAVAKLSMLAPID